MKEKKPAKKQFTRSRLVKELSWTCELPQTNVNAILDALVAIARREASNTFVLPGICKLEVVRRKPRKTRNPRTGESFMLPERDALRITAPRSLKLACAKVITPVETPAAPAAEAAKPAPAPAAAVAPAPTAAP
ncbi:MAG: HU family DNA-binding protein, partial [Kiritimatiellae bacterium]|nr:HU family DNA-binding protein [Kiritimatiellia bacterium]